MTAAQEEAHDTDPATARAAQLTAETNQNLRQTGGTARLSHTDLVTEGD
jgi:hypothetical protein